jgi:hypothetical protein
MAGLFFGNRDINVSIVAAQRFQFGFLNKCLLVTDEDDIPLQKLDGKTAEAALQTYLTDNTLTAPNLQAGLTAFISQADNSGNSIIPEYVYVIGATEVDVDASITLIEAAIDAVVGANDFYCLIPTFDTALWQTYMATFGNTHRRISMVYDPVKNRALADSEKSSRICGIYDPESEYKNAAWAGRVVSYKDLIAFKWKFLTGMTTDALPDGDVSTLEEAGWNGYREVRGLGETTGSRTTKNVAETSDYIDTIIIRDNIIYNVAGALHDMFRQNEIVPMGDNGRKLVEQAMGAALNFAGSRGLIQEFEDGTYQYSINVPAITAAMRSARELTDVEFTFVPTIPMEKITVTGQEILEWIEEGV